MRTTRNLTKDGLLFTTTRAWLSLSVFVLLASFSSAAMGRDLAEVTLSTSGIYFLPQVEANGFLLSVSGPDGRSRQVEFRGSEHPYLSVFGTNDAPMSDGQYTYELTAVYDSPTPAGPSTQSGYFSVANGAIVLPDSMGGSSLAGVSAADLPDPPSASTAADSLTITGGNTPFLRLDQDTSSGFTAQVWDVAGNEEGFFVRDNTAGSTLPFRILDGGAPSSSLVIADTGFVGLGTTTPTAKLHVLGSSGTTKLLVDENSGTVAKRFMLELENNGAPGFVFTNSGSGDAWQFAQTAVGDFTVSLIGTGGSELQINKDGRVTMGPGATQRFNLAPNGNLTIDGTLTQGSSREFKKDFAEIEPQDILNRVSTLPLLEWTYKTDSSEKRHLGPVAEDFRAAFGLGEDDKHIAPMDAAGVALASIQAMHGLLEEKDQRIADLEARLAAIEEAMRQLNSTGSH